MPEVRIPIMTRGKSLNELKNLKVEASSISKQEENSTFWQQDRSWRNFRVHLSAHSTAAGSSQADPEELAQILSNADIGFSVDLRQEPHGFILGPEKISTHWVKVTYTNISNLPTPVLKAKDLVKFEKKLLHQKMKKHKMTFFHISKDGRIKRVEACVKEAETEKQAVKRINKERELEGKEPVKYLRIPILDGMPPTPKTIDKLIDLHKKASAAGKGIYFHCSHGKGRTTTALVINDIMNGKTAEEALAENAAPPGKDLRTINTDDLTNPILVKASADRLGLIHRFSDYWNSQAKNNMTFNNYIKECPIDKTYETQMMASLSIRDSRR